MAETAELCCAAAVESARRVGWLDGAYWWQRTALAMVLTLAAADAPGACRDIRRGEVLSQNSAARADGCLPEPFLELYARGKFNHSVDTAPAAVALADIAAGRWAATSGVVAYRQDDDFLRASAENVGRYQVDANGSIVGEQTHGGRIKGLPFPAIDARDPQSGTEIVWNHGYAADALGPMRTRFSLDRVTALGPGFTGPDQAYVGPGRWRVGDMDIQLAAGSTYRVGPFRTGVVELLARPMSEMSLEGAVADWMRQLLLVQREPLESSVTVLRNRYANANKLDDYWFYIPSLRRVRRLASPQQGESLFGSGASLDTLLGFDGKPELFTFRLVEQTEQLVPFDEDALANRVTWRETEPGVRQLVLPRVPTIGYFERGRRGVAWEPLHVRLAVRPVWIVEARPKLPQYPFAKLVLVFDRDVFTCPYILRYIAGSSGEVLFDGIWTPIGYSRLPDGRAVTLGAPASPKLWVNFGDDSALVAGLSHPAALVELGRAFDPGVFTVSTMVQVTR